MEDKNNKCEKWDDPHLTKVTWDTKTVNCVKRIRMKYSQQIVSTTLKSPWCQQTYQRRKLHLRCDRFFFWLTLRNFMNQFALLTIQTSTWNGNRDGISLSKEMYFDEMLWVIILFSPPTSWKIIINLLIFLWCAIKVQNILCAMILKWKTNN